MLSTLYSIGHGRKPLGQFIAELKEFDIKYLADVRSKPYSRFNPQYNKKALEQSLADTGITYVFMGDELGGRPEDESCYTNGKVDYNLVKDKVLFKTGLKRLITAHEKKVKLAIMCSESKPQDCHRSRLIGKELLKSSVDILHITDISAYIAQSGLAREDLFKHD